MTVIQTEPLTPEAFMPFGEVLEGSGKADMLINQGYCERFHDLAGLDFDQGRAGISLFNAKPRSLPYTFDLVERHPLGSQAFIPMHQNPFLVIVAPDENGTPGTPLAFLTAPGQGINIRKNTWHGVLTPLSEPGLFAVIDRIGTDEHSSPNLEEYTYDDAHIVEA